MVKAPSANPVAQARKKVHARRETFTKAADFLALNHVVSEASGTLPCREEQHTIVRQFCLSALGVTAPQSSQENVPPGGGNLGFGMDGTNRVLYLSGVPGVGKTATVRLVLDQLAEDRNVPPFNVVYVNGMHALQKSGPNEIFRSMWKQLRTDSEKDKKLSVKMASDRLDKYFEASVGLGNCDKKVTILLIDEIDFLVTKSQSVLYKLMDWPSLSTARLAIIAIANTMDLYERLLPRIQSRMGYARYNFPAYSKDQLVRIVTERLKALNDEVTCTKLHKKIGRPSRSKSKNVAPENQEESEFSSFEPIFEEQAIELCAMKVATMSGDVRKALQVCQSALEIVKNRAEELCSLPATSPEELTELAKVKVKPLDVRKALGLMYSQPVVGCIARLPPMQRTCLLALLLERAAVEMDGGDCDQGVSLVRLHKRMCDIYTAHAPKCLPKPTAVQPFIVPWALLEGVVQSLEEQGLVQRHTITRSHTQECLAAAAAVQARRDMESGEAFSTLDSAAARRQLLALLDEPGVLTISSLLGPALKALSDIGKLLQRVGSLVKVVPMTVVKVFTPRGSHFHWSTRGEQRYAEEQHALEVHQVRMLDSTETLVPENGGPSIPSNRPWVAPDRAKAKKERETQYQTSKGRRLWHDLRYPLAEFRSMDVPPPEIERQLEKVVVRLRAEQVKQEKHVHRLSEEVRSFVGQLRSAQAKSVVRMTEADFVSAGTSPLDRMRQKTEEDRAEQELQILRINLSLQLKERTRTLSESVAELDDIRRLVRNAMKAKIKYS